ncbi:hypothetical protein I3842_03G061800 [Carya illinoinensis]|uniref:Uncharacterized protein n=1 Tax=Carya illinoinensis TaxID=32201 RepID=A0A922JX48_CARIL|nr:hypothetical protein I3842_03G061800 [Carya illinoinensis]
MKYSFSFPVLVNYCPVEPVHLSVCVKIKQHGFLSAFLLCFVKTADLKHHARQAMQIRAQSFSNEGKSSNIVDANLTILREKIELLKTKERLERCCRFRLWESWFHLSWWQCLSLPRFLLSSFDLLSWIFCEKEKCRSISLFLS